MIQKAYYINVKNKKDTKRIAVSCAMPENPRFIVQLLHGVSERYTRYSELMWYIAENGGIAVMHDGRGHGLTAGDGELGFPGEYYGSDEVLFDDIDAVCASVFLGDAGMNECMESEIDVRGGLPEVTLPRYLFGFSMGAMQAALYAGRNSEKLSGCILAGLPKHEPFVSPALFGLRLLSLITGEDYFSASLNKTAFTRYNRGFTPEPESDGSFLWLSRDIINRIAFSADPLCFHKNPIILYEYLLRLVRDVYRPSSYGAKRRDMPILLMAGEQDPVSGGDKNVLYAEKFLGDIGFKNVKSLMYKNMRHEIFYDFDREQPMNDLISFVYESLDSEEERMNKIKGEYASCFEPKA
ncbi:MAG: alpha/beta fold hydrolase [Eubacteriales bacterium]